MKRAKAMVAANVFIKPGARKGGKFRGAKGKGQFGNAKGKGKFTKCEGRL